MKQKYAYFSKNILFFSIGSFVPKLLRFVLVPLYTNCLTPEEYGTADLISVTVSLCIPLFTLGIQDAVLRFAMDKNYEKEDVLSVALKIILGGFLLVCLGSVAVWKSRIGGLELYHILYFLGMYLVSALMNSVSLFCRGTDNVVVMVSAGILNTIVTLLANIFLLAVYHKGLAGFLLANMLGTVAGLLYCMLKAKLFRSIRIHTPRSVFRDMTVFSIPLIFNAIAWWVNSALDRYMLSWVAGIAISGLYAVAYKIPNILAIFQGVFFQAWSISAVKEFDREDKDGFVANVYSMTAFAMVAVCSGLMIATIPLAKILFANEFFAAWQYSAPLIVSAVFNAMSLFIGSIFTAVKDTKTLATSTVIGASVNLVCNLVLIPRFAAYGAAIATLLGYLTVWGMRCVILRKHIHLRINRGRELFTYTLLIVQAIVSLGGISTIPVQLVIFIVILWLHREELRSACNQLSVMLRKRFARTSGRMQ